MNKINKNWKEVKLEDIVDITMGQSPKSQFYNKINKGMPFLQGSSTFGHLYPSFEIYSSDIKKIAVNGSILMSVRAPVGDLNMANTDICIGRGLCSINGKNKSLNRYIFYLLNYYKSKIVNIQTGTVFGAISKDNILNFKVSIPQSEKEQKYIASILSALDDKIELNNKTNKILEEMAQTIFKEWFINFNFPNEDGKPYKKSGGEMIDSELGKIPKGWKIGTIGDIAREVICGKTPPTKDKENYGSYMPFITIPDMHNNIYVVKTERYLSKKGVNTQSKKTIPKNSICVSCIATVGVVSLVSEYSQTNQQINSIIPKGKVSSYWVYFYIKNIKDMIINYASSGTTTLNLNKSQFEKIKIIIPYDNLFMSFNEIVNSLFDMIRNNQIENEKLSNIRDSLLPKLMTPNGRRADGEIRVNGSGNNGV